MAIDDLVCNIQNVPGMLNTEITDVEEGFYRLRIELNSSSSYLFEIDDHAKTAHLDEHATTTSVFVKQILPWVREDYHVTGVTRKDLRASEQPSFIYGPQGTRPKDFEDVLDSGETIICAHHIIHDQWAVGYQPRRGAPVTIARTFSQKHLHLLETSSQVPEKILSRVEEIFPNKLQRSYHSTLGKLTHPAQDVL